MKLDDFIEIQQYLLDIASEKFEILYKMSIWKDKLDGAFTDSNCLEESSQICDYIIDIHNNKLDYDYVDSKCNDDGVMIDVVEELSKYNNSTDKDIDLSDISKMVVGIVQNAHIIMLLIFYLQIIEYYKFGKLK